MLIEPAPEHLRLAWRRLLALGKSCPASFEAAMAHPVWSRAVHGLAVNLSRRATPQGRNAGAPTPAAAPAPMPSGAPAAGPPHQLPLWRRAGGTDLKRAAANDRDD